MSTSTWTIELQSIPQFKIHPLDFIREGDAPATIKAWATLAEKQNRSADEIAIVTRIAAEGDFNHTRNVLNWITDLNAAVQSHTFRT